MIDINSMENELNDYKNTVKEQIKNVDEEIKQREKTIELIKNLLPTTINIVNDLTSLVTTSQISNQYSYEVQKALIIDKHIKNLLFTKKLEEIIE